MKAAIAVGMVVLSGAAELQVRDGKGTVGELCGVGGRVVVDTERHPPLRRTTVTGFSTASPNERVVSITDDDGRFVLRGLRCGNVVVSASRPGYVTTHYGAARAGSTLASPVKVTAEAVPDLEIVIPKGGVIAGTVTDERGRPVPGITVRLRKGVKGAADTRVWRPLAGAGMSTRTDDLGAYRLFGLEAGEYTVFAEPLWSAATDLRRMSTPDVRPSGAGAAPSLELGEAVAPALIHYPGTYDAARAGVIALNVGQERLGIDFSLQYVRTVSVSGRVTDELGQPTLGAQVTLVPGTFETLEAQEAATLRSVGLLGSAAATTSGVDGRFQFHGVQPGHYLLIGSLPPSTESSGLWASTTVELHEYSQNDLALQLHATQSLEGSLVFTGAQRSAEVVTITLRPAYATGSPVTARVPIRPDGRFTVSNVPPGRYRLMAVASGSILQSAMIGAVDVSDTPFAVSATERPVIDLRFGAAGPSLVGTLDDGSGQQVNDLYVGVFSTDRQTWFQGSRRLRAPVRVSSAGEYEFTDLPAGEYYVAAVTEAFPRDWFLPEFLQELVPMAVVVSIGTDGPTTMNLKVLRTP